MNKRCLWLANGCLEHHRPIIINSCPPKRSQKSLIWRTIPTKIHGLNFRLLISIFKFITWILQLNSKIYTLPLEFTSLENVNFQLDEHIFIQYHCYFLLDLMTEPLLYIWLIYEALFTLQWSLVETKKPLWGWEMATDRPPPPVLSSIMLCEKSESVGNTRLLPQAKICLIALFKRKALYCC